MVMNFSLVNIDRRATAGGVFIGISKKQFDFSTIDKSEPISLNWQIIINAPSGGCSGIINSRFLGIQVFDGQNNLLVEDSKLEGSLDLSPLLINRNQLFFTIGNTTCIQGGIGGSFHIIKADIEATAFLVITPEIIPSEIIPPEIIPSETIQPITEPTPVAIIAPLPEIIQSEQGIITPVTTFLPEIIQPKDNTLRNVLLAGGALLLLL